MGYNIYIVNSPNWSFRNWKFASDNSSISVKNTKHNVEIKRTHGSNTNCYHKTNNISNICHDNSKVSIRTIAINMTNCKWKHTWYLRMMSSLVRNVSSIFVTNNYSTENGQTDRHSLLLPVEIRHIIWTYIYIHVW